MLITEKTFLVFKANQNKVLRRFEVIDELRKKGWNFPSVDSAIAQLVMTGKIRKVKHGHYAYGGDELPLVKQKRKRKSHVQLIKPQNYRLNVADRAKAWEEFEGSYSEFLKALTI